MTGSESVAGERSCLLVREATVRALVSRLDVFDIVRSASLQKAVQHGPAVSARLSGHDIGVKIGNSQGAGFGIKVRAGAEGNYVSIAWDDGGALIGLVESSYLTYCRTAAALLLAATELSSRVSTVLIMGSGRLGHASALLARELYPDSRIQLWSPRSREISDECDDVLDGWWTPDSRRDEHFDMIVTCTRSSVPLPLDTVTASYVSVGGAVDGHRRELSRNLLCEVGAVYADDPRQALLKCRDLDGLSHGPAIRPLSDAISASVAPVGRILTFVCGSGGFDVVLAVHVLRLASGGQMKLPAVMSDSPTLPSRGREPKNAPRSGEVG